MTVQQSDTSETGALLRSRAEVYEFRFYIAGFEKLAKTEQTYVSPSFVTSGLELIQWRIEVSPSMDKTGRISQIDCRLKKTSREPNVYSNESHAFHFEKTDGDFKVMPLFGYFIRFLEVDTLSHDGKLIVECCIRLDYYSETAEERCGPNIARQVKSANDTEGLEELQTDFRRLHENEKNSDVVIRCGDAEFKAHKAVLTARSTVFSKMFEGGTKECQDEVVILEETTPEAVRALLQFVYCSELEEKFSAETFIHLYVMAVRYDLCRLKSLCQDFLAANLSVDHVCEAAILAHVHNDEYVLGAAREFLNGHLRDLMPLPAWIDLASKYPVVAKKLLKP